MRKIILVVSMSPLCTASVLGQPIRATIEGGADDSGQNYSWTVTNHHTVAINFVEFPHFRADTFIIPAGWERDCTNLARVGGTPISGVCRATAAGNAAIGPARSAVFGMRLSRAGALRRMGNVTIRFADGSQTVVSGVQLPTRQSFWERHIMIVGLSVIFGVFLVVQFRRKKRADQGS